jgi:precorrin-2/cobalt-factor-2 C20-methyltransferase
VGGRLTGVGVGPGDPDLITVKGLKVLRESDVVFVPVDNHGHPGYAEGVVLAHVDPGRVRRVVFALGGDQASREESWRNAATAVAEVVGDGGWASFATIGDPNLYSTFTYLWRTVAELVDDVSVDTIPGITAMQDLASRSATVLAEGAETVALLPFTAGVDRLREALGIVDTVVIYKGGRFLPQVRAVLEEAGRLDRAVFGAKLGLAGEVVGAPPDSEAPYLSTVIVR